MRNSYKNILIANVLKLKGALICTVLLLSLVSCRKGFKDIKNENASTTVSPYLLFTSATRATFTGTGEMGQQAAQFYVNYNGGQLDEITYYFQRSNFNEYSTLRQVERMRIEAKAGNYPEYYEGLAKFLRSYLFYQMTMRVGDIPYSDALNAMNGVTAPKYDKQKDVFIGILKELEEANQLIPVSGNIVNDLMFAGDLNKWKRFVNTFRLKVLLSLSQRESDADLKIKEQFKMIVEDQIKYPLMRNSGDNAQFKYYDIPGAKHFWATLTDKTPFRMSNTIGTVLKANQDPRLFVFFQVPEQPAGLNPTNFNSYIGINHGQPTAITAALEKTSAPLNSRYRGQPTVEPWVNLGYHELQFVLAEASYRGWISGNTETFYEEAIRSSCKFYGISDGAINTFLAGPVKYDSADALRQINTQRWVAYFMNSGYDALWNHRRTRMQGFDSSGGNTSKGYPEFEVGSANRNDGQLPYRFLYPLDEINYNFENVAEAIRRQYVSDDINGKMWLLNRN